MVEVKPTTEMNDSQLLKFLQDPGCTKFLISLASFLQILIIGISEVDGRAIFAIVVTCLTFLASFIIAGIIANKRTCKVENCCILKLVSGKKTLEWNNLYYIYTIAFGWFNFIAFIAYIIAQFNGYRTCGYLACGVFSLGISLLYGIESNKTFKKLDFEKCTNSSTENRYVQILKFFGRFPIFLRIVLLVLSFSWILLVVTTRSYYWRSEGYQVIMAIIPVGLMIIALLDARLIWKLRKDEDMHATYTIMLVPLSLCGYGFGFPYHTLEITWAIVTGTNLISLLISFSAIHRATFGEDCESMLPKTIPKNVMNPIILDNTNDAKNINVANVGSLLK